MHKIRIRPQKSPYRKFLVLLLVSISFLAPSTTFGGTDSAREFFPGYVINLEGDTIKGEIAYNRNFYEASRNPLASGPKMIIKVNGVETKFKPRKLKGFGALIRETWRHYEMINFKYKGIGRKSFLRRIVDGTVTLYESTFIHRVDMAGNNLNEIKSTVYYLVNIKTGENIFQFPRGKKSIRELVDFFYDCNEVTRKIKGTRVGKDYLGTLKEVISIYEENCA